MNPIKKIIPFNIKRAIQNFVGKLVGLKGHEEFYNQIKNEMIRVREADEKIIPKFELKEKHIAHLKVVLDRDSLLREMPIGGICAEIGVNEGEFSSEILKITRPERLHLIDAWGDPARYHDELKDKVRSKFGNEIKNKSIELNVGYSTIVLETFPDKYFDWVYLDTDHTYQTTSAELNLLKEKVKDNGIIAGHDYSVGNWVGGFRYGVIEAVHELCVKEDWEILYLTIETDFSRSFAIRKII